MRKKNLLLIMILILFSTPVYASPYFKIAHQNDVFFPTQIVLGRQAIGDYLVINATPQKQTAHLTDIASGFQLIATDLSNSCGNQLTFDLAGNQTCILRFAYNANTLTNISTPLFQVCPEIGRACEQPSFSTLFSVAEDDEINAVSLSSNDNELYFAPGETTLFTVTNNTDTVANNVQVSLPPDLAEYVADNAKTTCASLAKNESCIFRLPMHSDLPVAELNEAEVTVEGSNTESLELDAHVSASLLSASNIAFENPSTQFIRVTNYSNFNLQNLTITLAEGAHGVSFDEDGKTCGNTLAANSHCDYALTASPDAYGNAIATIATTTTDGELKSANATVSVDKATIAINPDKNSHSQDITGNVSMGGNFTVTNTSAFNIHELNITHESGDDWLTLDSSQCGNILTVGNSCLVSYIIGNQHDMASVITIRGNNIDTTQQDFLPDSNLSLGVEDDESYQHMRYRALRVTNLTAFDQQLVSINANPPAALANNITLCDATGSNCSSDYASTCLDKNKLLSPNGSCFLWYKANTNSQLSPETQSNITATIEATTNNHSNQVLTKTINFSYGNELYVGGAFSKIEKNSVKYLAKWDGNSWHALGSGMGNRVVTLTSNGADLYAAGYFKQAGGHDAQYIARWDGNRWNLLGNTPNKRIFSLLADGKNLYAGGQFTQIGSEKMLRVAKWDGFSWSSLGSAKRINGTVLGLAMNGNNLYTGGNFKRVNYSSASGLARWDGHNWTTLHFQSTGRPKIKALQTFNNTLFIGGVFSMTTDGLPVNNIAYQTAGNWHTFNSDYFQQVHKFATYQNQLVIGGKLYNPATKQYYSLAQWDGSSLDFLGAGLNRQVFALTATENTLYLGGYFKTGNRKNKTDYLQQWDGENWHAIDPGFNKSVFALIVVPHLTLS